MAPQLKTQFHASPPPKKKSFLHHLVAAPSSPPRFLASSDLFSVPVILPFPQCRGSGVVSSRLVCLTSLTQHSTPRLISSHHLLLEEASSLRDRLTEITVDLLPSPTLRLYQQLSGTHSGLGRKGEPGVKGPRFLAKGNPNSEICASPPPSLSLRLLFCKMANNTQTSSKMTQAPGGGLRRQSAIWEAGGRRQD